MSTGYQRNLETLWPVDGKKLNVNLGWRPEQEQVLSKRYLNYLYKEWISTQYSYSLFWQADNYLVLECVNKTSKLFKCAIKHVVSLSFTLIAADLFISLYCEYNINNVIPFLTYTTQ